MEPPVNSALVIDWSREAIRMALLLGGPVLLAALVVGVLMGIAQTVVQLHEPVVGLVPRLIVTLIVLLAVLPWMLGVWVQYAAALIDSVPGLL